MVIHSDRASRGSARERLDLPGRRGFTLIELLVALVLLDIGLLALVGLGATMSRDASDVRNGARGARIAEARIETLASLGCVASLAGTTSPAPGVRESYASVPGPNETLLLGDSVTVILSRNVRTTVLRTRGRC
jgi:prepilin-type N-terminal cleavage/methylation domain-containing protein